MELRRFGDLYQGQFEGPHDVPMTCRRGDSDSGQRSSKRYELQVVLLLFAGGEMDVK